MHKTWTDVDGDKLTVTGYDDGHANVCTARMGNGVLSVNLSRAEVLELYHALGDHLMATAQDNTEAEAVEQPAPCTKADGYGWPDLEAERPESVLAEAERLVYGDREADYDHPRKNLTRTAILWTGVLLDKLADGEHIAPEDVARCMVGTKLSRDVSSPKRDNRVDGSGYFLLLDRLETGK